MFKLFNNFYSPDDATGTGGTPSGEMSKEDIIDFLGQEDEPVEPIPLKDKNEKETPTKESKEKEEPEDESTEEEDEVTEEDELKEIEDELKEPTEEQLELTTPVRRKEILKKYPNIFKDFPYLEKAYYREQQFTQLLPTIDDAKEAVSKSETLDKFESDLMDGNTKNILLAAKSLKNPKAFNKIVDNYLSVLSEVDEKSFHHVIGNTIKHTIIQMSQEARTSGNEALQAAAHILNQFVFGKSEFQPPSKLTTEDKPDNDKSELDRERQSFMRQKFNDANSNLNEKVNKSYKATIEANIDPKQSMSDYVRRNASREALETLDDLISKDTRFKTLVDKLWEAAIKENFSKSSLDRINSAFTSKARTLLPSVIKKARIEALKGMGKRVVNNTDKEDETPSNKKSPSKDTPPSNSRGQSKEKVPAGMSTLEYLMKD